MFNPLNNGIKKVSGKPMYDKMIVDLEEEENMKITKVSSLNIDTIKISKEKSQCENR